METRQLPDTADDDTLSALMQALPPRPVSTQVQVDVAGMSHQGKVRQNNEDIFLVVRMDRALQAVETNLAPGQVPARFEEIAHGMVVADGMGGMAAGEVASSMAVTSLVNLVLNSPDWIMRIGDDEAQRMLERINERYQQVDQVLSAEAAFNPDLSGMGTTLTLVCSIGLDMFLGHVGDSRVYYLRDGVLHRLTRDHTSAQALADLGLIDQAAVATHRLRHVLTRVLGGHDGAIQADARRLRLAGGDQVLLCSDGLTEMVDDAAIATILAGAPSAQAACQSLIDAALANGGKDNVTAVVARYSLAV